MSLSITEIVKLANAGFSADTINLLNMMGGSAQPAVNPAPLTQPAVNPAPLTQPAVNPAPLTQPAQQTIPNDPNSQAAYIKALQDLNLRLVTGQMPTGQQTADDILAGIINPPTDNKGGTN